MYMYFFHFCILCAGLLKKMLSNVDKAFGIYILTFYRQTRRSLRRHLKDVRHEGFAKECIDVMWR